MQGYAKIGTIYLLREEHSRKNLVWAVIENNSNDKTSTLLVIEACPENGIKAKVDAQWLYERDPIGPIFPVNGDIVVEDGIEFIKPHEEKAPTKVLKPKNIGK